MPKCGIKVIIFSGICLIKILYVNGHCVDIHSQIVSQGLHYVPGPNSCTLCICDKGGPKWCKSVLCSQPQNCKSFQRGNSCCEFKCLDDILTANDTYKDTYDLALRLIASAVFVILTLLLLFFFVHRFRKHKLRVRQNRQLSEDQRSLNSIGYITGSLGYLPGSIGYLGSGTNDLEFHYEESNAHFSLWKPPGNYFPRGEAPPPYEEAIRSTHIESNIVNHNVGNSTQRVDDSQSRPSESQQIPIQCRHQHLTSRSSQEYANVTIETIAMQQTVKNPAQLSQDKSIKSCASEEKSKSYENIIINRKNDKPTSSNSNSERRVYKPKVQVDKNNFKFHKYENMILKNPMPKDSDGNKKLVNQNQQVESNVEEVFYENITPSYETIRHRAAPHISELQSKSVSHIRELKNKENIYIVADSSTRRDLDKTKYGERSENNLKILSSLKDAKDIPLHRTLPKNLKELTVSVSSNSEYIAGDIFKRFENDNFIHRTLPKHLNHDTIFSVNLVKSQINLTENNVTCSPLKSNDFKSASSSRVEFHDYKVEDVPKCKDDRRSFISYQCLSSSQDEDDYRSECENCKSSEIVNLEDEEGDVFNETMTLQRRPETSEEVPYYRTSLTLPTQIRKPKAVTPNSNRNGWFMAMQEHSSSEESD